MLTNNGFADRLIEDVINNVLTKHIEREPTTKQTENNIIISHCMTYGSMFRQESDAIRHIVKRGVAPVEPHGDVTLRIYCRPNLTASMVMRNNNAPRPSMENESHVVNRYECTVGACRGRGIDYVGLTTTTVRKRMDNHRYSGAIHMHFKHAHGRRPKTNELLENTTILHRVPKYHRLAISEAVCIELRRPVLNVQREFDLVLPSCRRTRQEIVVIPDSPSSTAPTSSHGDTSQQNGEEGPRGDARGEATGDEAGAEQELPRATDYVRQRLRPRTRATDARE